MPIMSTDSAGDSSSEGTFFVTILLAVGASSAGAAHAIAEEALQDVEAGSFTVLDQDEHGRWNVLAIAAIGYDSERPLRSTVQDLPERLQLPPGVHLTRISARDDARDLPAIYAAEERLNDLRERGTCSQCLARTYRGEECVCDEGDAEDVAAEFDQASLDHAAALGQ